MVRRVDKVISFFTVEIQQPFVKLDVIEISLKYTHFGLFYVWSIRRIV